MKELPAAEMFKLKGLITNIIPEMNMSERVTADEVVMNFYRAASSKYLKVFVNDPEDVKHLLAVCHVPSMLSSGFVCLVHLMYSVPGERGGSTFHEMHRIIDQYAKDNKWEEILGGSWKYQGARDIDKAWTSKGYEEQESTFIKILR